MILPSAHILKLKLNFNEKLQNNHFNWNFHEKSKCYKENIAIDFSKKRLMNIKMILKFDLNMKG